MKIISGILILITAFLSFKHGWEGLVIETNPAEPNLFTQFGIGKTGILLISLLSIAVGLMVLFPPTFFAGNLINAVMILSIMGLSLKTGNLKIALIEIPFLLMPLVMIYLGHPFKK
ncbi:hypothetical protein SAMN05216167_109143 [Spirosoma endophyticum]|uniref:DoxX-like family protein n=2 Tax=Spirosoma endophyticum TaxID=662367 RepID=A0A1I1X1I9_9BACT|nr:hypothetical protein SAMN05216167_109143 [Spirosoma endophyticum]